MSETIAELLVKVSADVEDFRSKMDGAASLMDSMASRFTSAGVALSAGVTAPLAALGVASVGAAGEMDSLMRALTAVTGSAAKAQAEFSQLKEVAKLPGLGLEEAVQGAVRLQAAGVAADVAQKSLMAFGNALASVGKGRADLDAVTLQLSQLWNATSIKESDLKPIRERIPQLAAIMKELYGTISADGLRDKGVGPQEFVLKIIESLNKLPPVTGGIKNDIENFKDSLQQSFAQLGNALTPFVSQFVNVLGPAIQNAVQWFSQLNPAVQNFIIITAGVAAVIGPFLFAIGGMASGVSAILGLVGPLGGAVVLLKNLFTVFAEGGLGALATATEGATLFGVSLTGLGAAAGTTATVLSGLAIAIGAIAGAFVIKDSFDWLTTELPQLVPEINAVGTGFASWNTPIEVIQSQLGALGDVVTTTWGIFTSTILGGPQASSGSSWLDSFIEDTKRDVEQAGSMAVDLNNMFFGTVSKGATQSANSVATLTGVFTDMAAKFPQQLYKWVESLDSALLGMQTTTKQLNSDLQSMHNDQVKRTQDLMRISTESLEKQARASGLKPSQNDASAATAAHADGAKNLQAASAAATEMVRKFADAYAIETDAHKLLIDYAKELNSAHDSHISKLAKLTVELDKYKDKAAETAAILARMANVPPPPDIGGTYSKPTYDENGNQVAGAPVGLNYPKVIPHPQSPDDSELDIPTGSKEESPGKQRSVGTNERTAGDDMAREVDKAFDHISRGIADNIAHWDGFSKTIQGSLKSLGSGMLEVFTQRLLSPLKDAVSSFASSFADKLFGGLTSKVGSWLGNAVGGLFGGGSSGGGSGIGGQVTTAAVKLGAKVGLSVATGGTSDAAEGMMSGGGGSGSSLLDMGMKVADYFKQSEIETGLDAIEHEVRYSQIHLSNMLEEAQKYWPRLLDINNDFYQYFEYFGTLMTTQEAALDELRAIRQLNETISSGAVASMSTAFGSGTTTDENGQTVTADTNVMQVIWLAITQGTAVISTAIQTMTDRIVNALGAVADTRAVPAINDYQEKLQALMQSNESLKAQIESTKAELKQAKDDSLKASLQKKIDDLEGRKDQNDAAIQSIKDAMSAIGKSLEIKNAEGAKVADKIGEMQHYLGELIASQSSILDKLPLDIRTQLQDGKVGDMSALDEGQKALIAEYQKNTAEVTAVKEALAALGQGKSPDEAKKASSAPADGPAGFGQNQIHGDVTVDSGAEGIMGVIGQLIEVEQGGWSHLFELLEKGLPDITTATEGTENSAEDTAKAVTSSGIDTAEGLQQLATAVSNPTTSGGGSITDIPLTTTEAARAVTGVAETTWKAASVNDLNWTVGPDTQLPSSGGSRTTAGMLFDPSEGYDPFTRRPVTVNLQVDSQTLATTTIRGLRDQGIRV